MIKSKKIEKEKKYLRWLPIPSKLILEDNELRLNANSYSFEYLQAVSIIEKLKGKGVFVDSLGHLAERIFVGARSKRLYTSKDIGIPYLMPTDIFNFYIKPRKWIKPETEDSDNWFVEPLTILITQSGSVGRSLIVNNLFQGIAISPNAIRYILKENQKGKIGYIYAWINTKFGQALITKNLYGITVKHIEPHHIAQLPIPRLPEIEDEIHNLIMKAHKLREEAQEKLLKAEELFYKELKLPRTDEENIKYFGGEKGKEIKAFIVKSSKLEDRFDASYHIPLAKYVLKILLNAGLEVKRLKDGIAKVFHLPTYKRIYTNKEEGYPILSGTHLTQIRYLDVKYISSRSFLKKNKLLINDYKIKEGWILTTERGTIGLSMLVSKFTDNWLASHNILRVIPKNINNGYLLVFLNSEYGRFQLLSKGLGAVVNVLDPKDMEKIYIPIPDKSIQDRIGSLVIEAYNKKDQANILEQQAIEKLETDLTNKTILIYK